jgi:hypothetical protein
MIADAAMRDRSRFVAEIQSAVYSAVAAAFNNGNFDMYAKDNIRRQKVDLEN